MTVMRWFRKNNKKLLVGIVFVIMLAFGLPNFFFRGNQQRDPGTVALFSVTEASGQELQITSAMIQQAQIELQVLGALGIDQVVGSGKLNQVPGFQGLGHYPPLMTYVLFFNQGRQGGGIRRMLYQEAAQSGWAFDKTAVSDITRAIDQLAATENSRPSLYYLLLAREAHHAGITARPDQVSALLKARPRNVSLEAINKKLRIAYDTQRLALANYIAILRYADSVSRTLDLSEPELQQAVANQVELESIRGTFVRFRAELFRDQVPTPTPEQVQEQFVAHRDDDPQDPADENPHGFGYKLPDRIQVEYLQANLAEAQEYVEGEFSQLPAREREAQVREFWSENRHMFTEAITPAPEDEDAPTERLLDFDEAAGRAETLYQSQQAQQLAETLLNQAKNAAQEALPATALESLTPEERAAKALDYAALAEKLNADSAVKLTYGRSRYLSEEDAAQAPFGRGQLYNGGADPLRLTPVLFNCRPLHQATTASPEEQPVWLYENVGPAFGALPSGANAGFLVRIVNVDQARSPESLADDGAAGPADLVTGEPNQSQLYQRVQEDLQDLWAFDLAKEHARQFAVQAEPNWPVALAGANQALLEDPNALASTGPLREQTLDAVRSQLDRIQQMVQQNPQYAGYARQMIMQQGALLEAVLKFAQERRQSPAAAVPVFEREEELACLVFKDLQIEPPTRQEYLRRRPLAAHILLQRSQGLLALLHFNPQNIEKRFNLQTVTEQ